MAISRIGSVTAPGTSLTPTVGLAGDVMVGWAFRSTAATIPTVPAGWIAIGSGSGNTCAGVLAYKFCTSTNDASGTWTGATQLIITKYRGVFGIGGSGTPSNATGTSISYPALTAIQTAGNSWIVGVAGHRTASNVSTAPTGMTNVSSVGTGPQAAFHDTNGGVSSWSAQSVTVNASSGHESITCELLADNSTFNPYKKGSLATLSSANLNGSSSGNTGGVGDNIYGTLPRSDIRIFKLTMTTVQSNDPNVGFANFNSSPAAFVGDSTDANNSLGWTLSGGVFLNGVPIATIDPFISGNVLWLVGDFVNFLFWGRVGSGNWNSSPTANPDTGVGGISFSTINAGPFYPICGFHDGSESVTADFGASGNPTSTIPAWDTNATSVSGFIAVTEAQDSLAATGSVIVSGAVAVTEGNDSLAATGSVIVSGSIAVTEAQDAFAASGSVIVSGAAALLEIQDSLAATGTVSLSPVSGTAAWTEVQDRFSAIGNNGVLDAGDPGIRKRRAKLEGERFEDERAKRARRRAQVIDAFERVIEGKPEISDEIADELASNAFGRFVEHEQGGAPHFDLEGILASTERVQALWNELLDRDDEEVLVLL